MHRVILADMIDSIRSWAAVFLAFVTTSAALTLAAIVFATGFAHRHTEWGTTNYTSTALLFVSGVNVALGCIVGASVLGTSTTLVIESRKPALARLRLAGASPSQVFTAVMVQVVAVASVASLVGSVLAFLSADLMVAWNAADRAVAPVPAVLDPFAFALGGALCIGTAVLGALNPARAAGRTSAVAALRESTVLVVPRRPGVGRWIALALVALSIAGAYASTYAIIAATRGMTQGDFIMASALGVLVLAGTFMAIGAPVLLAPFTRAWTALVPRRFVTMYLARENVTAMSHRLVRVAVPTMFSVGLMVGMLTQIATTNASLAASGSGIQLESSSALLLLGLMWVPLVIAVSGSIGSIVMTSKRRDADLALCAIIGATPAQRIKVAVAEGLIVTVSATLMGLFMAVISSFYLAWGFSFILPATVVAFPWAELAVIFLAALAVTTLAMVLPTLPAMRQPAPRVIARLIGE